MLTGTLFLIIKKLQFDFSLIFIKKKRCHVVSIKRPQKNTMTYSISKKKKKIVHLLIL
jgi:hypothetical protein